MIILVYILILFATIEFNKQLIDNVKPDVKQQKEWHIAQLVLWFVIYGSIMFLTKEYIQIIIFACFYPFVYDTLLNLRRGLEWNHRGKHDLPLVIKYGLFLIGIILIIVEEL